MIPVSLVDTAFKLAAKDEGLTLEPVCSDEGLTLETSAKHHIPQATNIPYQPC